MHEWEPRDVGVAKDLAQECVTRAQALSALISEYAWGERAHISHVREAARLIEDLLYVAADMLDSWDAEEVTDPSPAEDSR